MARSSKMNIQQSGLQSIRRFKSWIWGPSESKVLKVWIAGCPGVFSNPTVLAFRLQNSRVARCRAQRTTKIAGRFAARYFQDSRIAGFSEIHTFGISNYWI